MMILVIGHLTSEIFEPSRDEFYNTVMIFRTFVISRLI